MIKEQWLRAVIADLRWQISNDTESASWRYGATWALDEIEQSATRDSVQQAVKEARDRIFRSFYAIASESEKGMVRLPMADVEEILDKAVGDTQLSRTTDRGKDKVEE